MTDAALLLKAAGRRVGCYVSHPGPPARLSPHPRAPGFPLLHSRDLVGRPLAGHGLERGLFAAAPEGPGHAGAATFSQFRISAQ
ncbi:hypothetical protein ABZ770_25615 [Streptomyces sp. NPDC006654]|uniref:hypothetical protein n=1 Tax=unclassified Streptomyces TaxID=2593676 RepID=UPI0033C88457